MRKTNLPGGAAAYTPWMVVIAGMSMYILACPLYPFFHDRILGWCSRYMVSRSFISQPESADPDLSTQAGKFDSSAMQAAPQPESGKQESAMQSAIRKQKCMDGEANG